jgi:PAS domain S-box-containing protein
MALAALRALPETSIVVFDDDLRYVLVAGGAVRQEGFDQTDLQGRLISGVLSDERWAFWEPIYRAALSGTSSSVEVTGRDGRRWYRVDVGPWRDGDTTGGLAMARDITERKRAQDHVAGLLDSAPDAMVVVDGAGTITLVNTQAERMFGYPRSELLGQPAELLVGERRGAAARSLRQMVDDGIADAGITHELHGRRRDGSEFPAEISMSPFQTDEGTLICGAIRNIAQRKRLEAQSSHLAAVVESSAYAIITEAVDGSIVSWNPGAQRLYGYAADEVTGRSIDILAPDGYPDEVRDLLERVAAGDRVDHLETLRQRKDGLLVDVTLTISPLHDPDGEIIGTSTIARDITAAKAAQSALIQARQDIDRFFELSLDLMVIAGTDGRFVRVNPAVVRTLGYTLSEMTERPFVEFVHPDDVDATVDAFSALVSGGTVGGFENRYRCQDGTYRWLQWNATGDDDGVVFATAHDVTQRKQLELDLLASREQALEASRLKSEFVANMSHEIRTPLNGVVSMAELLLGTSLNPDQADYAQVALTSAEALMRVINDILDFSKIEAGKLEILSEDFSVRAAVDEVTEIVGVKTSERGLVLDVSVDDRVAEVLRGDGNRVRQVLMNLLSNAVKFTTEGWVHVEVGLRERPDGAERVVFTVSDTGIGIGPDRLPELFQPFSQIDATTTRRHGGTGLGLCISKQLVELMGGDIGCESEPGSGSRFWFELPYEPGAGFEADLLGSDLTGTRVLIVSHLPAERQSLENCLASWGISPDSAPDGEAALELMRRAADSGRPYETALLDHALAGTDGLALARAIKSLPALRSTRLIMIGRAAADAVETQAAGIEAQLAKPIRPSRLYNQLMTILRRSTGSFPVLVRPTLDVARCADGGCRVLVAEDNEVNQFAAIRLLRSFGFSVDIAANGREAITMSGARQYAAVFMDCQMPEVDGYTAASVIRRREQDGATRTPIIAVTAHALEGDREKCLAAGMDDYLAKPLRLQTIAALIGRIPALAQTAAPAATAPDGVFDPVPLQEIGNPDTELRLARLFLDQASERLPALLAAIHSADGDLLHSLARELKGSSASVGATRMTELSRELCEIATAAGGIDPAAVGLHTQLAEALSQTSAALTSHLRPAAAA